MCKISATLNSREDLKSSFNYFRLIRLNPINSSFLFLYNQIGEIYLHRHRSNTLKKFLNNYYILNACR